MKHIPFTTPYCTLFVVADNSQQQVLFFRRGGLTAHKRCGTVPCLNKEGVPMMNDIKLPNRLTVKEAAEMLRVSILR